MCIASMKATSTASKKSHALRKSSVRLGAMSSKRARSADRSSGARSASGKDVVRYFSRMTRFPKTFTSQ